MYKKMLSLVILIMMSLQLVTSCTAPNGPDSGSQSSLDTDVGSLTTETAPEGEPVETTPDGGIKWTVLGYNESKTFAGTNAPDGKTIIILYVEARNTSTRDVYVSNSSL